MSKERNNDNKKKKVIIILIVFILFLILAGGILYYYIYILKAKDEKNDVIPVTILQSKYFSPTEEQIQKAEELSYSPIRITCGNNEDATLGYSYDFHKGDTAYCNFQIQTYVNDVHEIWTEYKMSDDVTFESAKELNGTQLLTEGNKLQFYIRNGIYEPFYQIKVKIGEKTGGISAITLPKVIIKTSGGHFYKYSEETNDSFYVNDTTKYIVKNEENKLLFYRYDNNEYKHINTYTCEEENCYAGGYFGVMYNDLSNGRTLIGDGKPKLFDFEKGILVTFDKITGALEGGPRDNPKIEYILGEIGGIQYIYDLNGKEIKSLRGYDEFKTLKGKMMLIKNVYSVENDLIVLSKKGKNGISKITEDKTIIDYKYDDIKLFDDKYFKAKENNKWCVYELGTGNKVTSEGYKQLFIADDNIMIVQIDDYLYIKDFKGNNLIEDKIKVLYDYQEFPAQFTPWGIAVDKYEDNIIDISVTSEPRGQYGEDFDIYRYKYNIKEKTLTQSNE